MDRRSVYFKDHGCPKAYHSRHWDRPGLPDQHDPGHAVHLHRWLHHGSWRRPGLWQSPCLYRAVHRGYSQSPDCTIADRGDKILGGRHDQFHAERVRRHLVWVEPVTNWRQRRQRWLVLLQWLRAKLLGWLTNTNQSPAKIQSSLRRYLRELFFWRHPTARKE